MFGLFLLIRYFQTASNPARSRVNSMSSVTSESAQSAIFGSYSTPQRKYYPPSDVESEFEADYQSLDQANTSMSSQSVSPASNETKKLHKLLDVYKTKYNQLKNAYDEVEAEKEKIKVLRCLLYNFYSLIRVGFCRKY